MDFLKRKVKTIFLMLGNGCNMNCVYCAQHPLIHHPLTNKVNPEIYDFIRQIQFENDEAVSLLFYGGEPLLYYPIIQDVVEKTKDFGLQYRIITNARALTDNMVDFFNMHQFGVAVSWDGPNVLETRGFDAFDPHNLLRRRILRLESLCLTGVISAKAYPKEILESMQKISNDYYGLHGYQLHVNLDTIFDTGLPDKSILQIDYARIENEMTEMAVRYLESIAFGRWERNEHTKMEYITHIQSLMGNFFLQQRGVYERSTCYCGNGINVLNLDLVGNLYTCHNARQIVGNIYSDYFSYLQELLKSDLTAKYRETCKSCPAVSCCQGGCKLVSEQARKESYCRLKRAVFMPVLRVFQAAADRVERR